MRILLSILSIIFLFSFCTNSTENKNSIEKKVIVKNNKKTKTEFEIFIEKNINNVQQPINYRDWNQFLFSEEDSIQYESSKIDMGKIGKLAVSFEQPDNFMKLASGFNTTLSKDWFYPEYFGDLNYLINKKFYIPIFYTDINDLYILAFLSAITDDNGVYPNIELILYNKLGAKLNSSDVYLINQCSFEGYSFKKQCSIINNQLFCEEFERAYDDEDSYESPYETYHEKIYTINSKGFILTQDSLIYRKDL